MNKFREKFIVIDGTDGSGKETQTKLLADRLRRSGFEVEIADFPQYGQKSAGLVEEYLNGKYGDADSVGPYRASIFYACDRFDASLKIKKWLSEGKIVISNRYVTANMGHQGGKIHDPVKRKVYFDWLYRLEYELFDIPKPDLNIILHVDAAVAQNLVDNKGDRDYVGGNKRDIHEADLDHLRNAEKVYLEIANSFPDFTTIECTRDDDIITRAEINDLVWHEVINLIGPHLRKLHDHNTEYFLNNNFESKPIETKKIETFNNTTSRISNSKFQLKIQRISPTAKLPKITRNGDAAFELYANDYYTLLPGDREGIKTGIKMQIPEGRAGLIWDKSGIAQQGVHTVGGVIDSNYRGEIIVLIKNLSEDLYNIVKGQKIAQILIQKVETPEIIEGEINDETERGENAFGSSGMF